MAQPVDIYQGMFFRPDEETEEEAVVTPAVEPAQGEVQAVSNIYEGMFEDDSLPAPEDLLPKPLNKLMIQR